MSTSLPMPVIVDPLLPRPIPVLFFDDVPSGTTQHALCAIAGVSGAQGALSGAQQQALLTDLHTLLTMAHVSGVAGAQGSATTV